MDAARVLATQKTGCKAVAPRVSPELAKDPHAVLANTMRAGQAELRSPSDTAEASVIRMRIDPLITKEGDNIAVKLFCRVESSEISEKDLHLLLKKVHEIARQCKVRRRRWGPIFIHIPAGGSV